MEWCGVMMKLLGGVCNCMTFYMRAGEFLENSVGSPILVGKRIMSKMSIMRDCDN